MSLLNYKDICSFDQPIEKNNTGLIVLYKKTEDTYDILHDFDGALKEDLIRFLRKTNASEKSGTTKIFDACDMTGCSYTGYIALCSIGNENSVVENVRKACANGLKNLMNFNVNDVLLSIDYMPQEMAIGAYLSAYQYDCLLKKKKDKINIRPLKENEMFKRGCEMAYHQNFARFLADTPANLVTPLLFVEYAKDFLNGRENIEIQVFDRKYMEENKMDMLLSVSNGSEQPPQLLVIKYKGRESTETDLSLVGKGITFDSGGISLKPSAKMSDMKADMMGAAAVLASIGLASSLKSKLNIIATIPLSENLPSGKATKPGDVVIAMNGLSVEIDNTDAEGRLVLGDALTYTQKEKPKYVIDVATLTGAIVVALGTAFIGMFCNDDNFSSLIEEAGKKTDDLVWRMPLSKKYRAQMNSQVADIKNAGDRFAGSCTAAIFLNEFIEGEVKWAHLDIAGVMNDSVNNYLYGNTMSGRPVLLLSEIIEKLAKGE